MNRVGIVIEQEAKSDIRVARDYYSDKGGLTSDRFRDELTQVFDLISRHPEAVAIAFGSTRLNQCVTSHTSLDTSFTTA